MEDFIVVVDASAYEYIRCACCGSYEHSGPMDMTDELELFICVECGYWVTGEQTIRIALDDRPVAWLGLGSRIGGV